MISEMRLIGEAGLLRLFRKPRGRKAIGNRREDTIRTPLAQTPAVIQARMRSGTHRGSLTFLPSRPRYSASQRAWRSNAGCGPDTAGYCADGCRDREKNPMA